MSHATIAALRHSTPYLRLYRGKLFVVKVGGEAFITPAGAEQLLEQIGVLRSLGINVVLVHGGGIQADTLGAQLGIASEKIEGRRLTSQVMIQTMILALNGEVQGKLLSAARRLGQQAVGISGMDADLIYAKRRGLTTLSNDQSVDLGEVGEIVEVNPQTIELLLREGLLPIISPLAGDVEGNWLNTNADTVAAEIAVTLKAEKVIFLSGTAGILQNLSDPNSLVSELSLAELRAMESSGEIKDGMLPKSAAIARCLEGGVPKVHVVSFAIPDALLIEVFTNEGSGTLVVSDQETGT